MSDKEVERLLRGLKSTPPKNRDEQEVAGYADLLGRVFDHWKTLTLSENTILQFHAILLSFSEKDQSHRGKYKMSDNTVVMQRDGEPDIVLFAPTKPYLVKSEMDAALDWTNAALAKGTMHPILVVANFVFEFLAIHPFLDGNGRLSRALTNLLLLQNGYAYIPYVSLDELIEKRREDYYLALRATQKRHKTKNEDLTPWLNFLLDTLLEQAQLADGLMQSQHPEKLLSEKQERVFFVFQDVTARSVSDVSTSLSGAIPLPTIKQALSRLVALNLLERTGQKRGVRYKKR